jgi:Histidine kinase-, DNA gyrase B-, and HSP90-like ATPase
MELMDGLPLIEGDRVQLQQVTLNLIINAFEAMSGVSQRARELLISTRKAESDGVLVAVRDSGPGLTPATLDHLFESFYTTKPGGLGLGLSICRSIVEAHGGRLWACPNVPCGAIFRFTVPAYPILGRDCELVPRCVSSRIPPPPLTSLGTPAQARGLGPPVPAVCPRLSPGQALDARFRGHTGPGNGPPEVAAELGLRAAFCPARGTAPRNGVLGALCEDWTPRFRGFRGFRCFRCFSQELSASEASCSAEILGSVGSGEQKTAKTPAAPPLFFAVFAPKNSDNRENRINAITKLLRAVAHQINLCTIPCGRSIVN